MFELSGVNYEEVLEQGDSILVRVIASSSYRGFELSGLYCTSTRNIAEINLAGRTKKSTKQFWSYVNSKLKTRTNIPTLIKSNGSEALNEYFGSVYKEESNDIPPVANHSSVPLSSINITDVMVLCKLRAWNPEKSTGPDGWHP